MNNELLAKGMALGLRSMGIEIDDWEDDYDSTTVWISVPREAECANGINLAGKALADRWMTKMREMGVKNFKVKYRIRDEVWTEEKKRAAVERCKREMYGG